MVGLAAGVDVAGAVGADADPGAVPLAASAVLASLGLLSAELGSAADFSELALPLLE